MAAYVDNMYLYEMGRYGRMKMSHMIADTDDELHAMAKAIGMSKRWWQSPETTSGSHYDICISKRNLAIELGAIPITLKECACMNFRRKVEGILGTPSEALEWRCSYVKGKEIGSL